MKKIKFLFLGIIAAVIVSACSNQYEDLNRDSDILTNTENTGGFVTFTKQAIPYVVGNGDTYSYGTDLKAFQTVEKVLKVEVYNQFTNIVSGVKSNKMLLKTLTFPNTAQTEIVANTFNYNDLKRGILVSGVGLGTDTTLNIGDYWLLSYVITTASGKVVASATPTKVSVSTRYAGTYKCITGSYYRIGVLTYTGTDWPSETIVESVNTTTYRVRKYFGPFNNSSTATGGDYYFSVDGSGNITYPANVPGTTIPQEGNNQPFITCISNPSSMTNVNCATSNFVTPDNVNGKDRLTMTFGYLASSGSREFYQVMEKL